MVLKIDSGGQPSWSEAAEESLNPVTHFSLDVSFSVHTVNATKEGKYS